MRRARLVALVGAGFLLASCASAGSVSVGPAAPSTSASDPSTTVTAPSTTGTAAPVTGPVSTQTVPTQPARPLPLTWSSCGKQVECATLPVPLDHADPSKGTIDLFVKRRPAGDPSQRIGTLFVNPGGPGLPGTELVDQADLQFSKTLESRFDILSWDPRGTGKSGAIDCVDDLDPYFTAPDPTPDTDAEKQALVDLAKTWDANCVKRSGRELPYISTQDTARDMDAIRASLGEDKVSYFGFSYGSTLGAVYATMFPEHVRAMVLDGASDPNVDYLDDLKDSATGMERALDLLLDQCSKDRGCKFSNGGHAAAAFDALVTKLDSQPLPSDDGRPPIGQAVLYYAVVSALYDQGYWPVLTDALADAQHGDGKALLAMYDDYLQRRQDGSWSNVFESLIAINCLDDPGPQGDPAIADQVAAQLRPIAPRFADWASYSYNCTFWPVGPAPKLHVSGAGAGPIVVVGTTGDPITPLASSQKLAQDLQQGVLLTVEGEHHTGYGLNKCSVREVDGYLVNLAVPAVGTVCR
jgi:pimeloyl-ACP methyl ester carboxylesterase